MNETSPQVAPGFSGRNLCTALVCAWCVFVCIALNIGGYDLTMAQAEHLGLFPTVAVWQGRPWALVSMACVHLTFWHIFFNVYWVWLLGARLEEAIGWWRWLLFFVGAAWVSSALQLLAAGSLGIGLSGVGYALMGFGWMTRTRYRSFAHILTDSMVFWFLLWLVGCAIATQLGLASIGNMAHLGGLLFGIAVAEVFVMHRRRTVALAGLIGLLVLALLPLYWCPRSPEWRKLQAPSLSAPQAR
jgi:GlpG protein